MSNTAPPLSQPSFPDASDDFSSRPPASSSLDAEAAPRSRELFGRAVELMPGGVNSPVRAFGAVGGTPRFMARGEGAFLFDEDGQRYIDFVGSWGPLIHGHAPKFVHDKVREQLDRGASFGAPTRLEVEMAALVCQMVPSIEMVRMVNSGTEAVMGALRAARGFTGRSKIIKFAGCYHGHADALLVQAGSGAMTMGTPDSAGVTQAQTQDTVVCHFNDTDGTRDVLRSLSSELACVAVEPLPANMGLVPPRSGFLEMLREETHKIGAVLLFDEVMTGFRQSLGGFQQLIGITPDATTLGKIIGGGFPVGAYGGQREMMECVAPSGPVYQAGTLSGNPIAMTAGLATLRALDDGSYKYLSLLGQRLEDGLRDAVRECGIQAQVQRVGSMWTLFFSPTPITDYESAKRCDTKMFGHYFHAMLSRGIYLPPSQFEAAFLSLAHTEEHVDAFVDASREALRDMAAIC